MLDCSQFFSEYSDFRDGRLDEARSGAFELHLRHCPSCARYDEVVGGGVDLVRALPGIEPSDDFLARLERRLRLEDAEAALGSGSASGASLAVMVAIVATLGAIAWTPVARPRVAVVELPPVTAHAPHRVEALHDLFRSGPLLSRPARADPTADEASTLLFRYSPLGSAATVPAFPALHTH